jgi:hypothetical protein
VVETLPVVVVVVVLLPVVEEVRDPVVLGGGRIQPTVDPKTTFSTAH